MHRALFLVWPVSFDCEDPVEIQEWDHRCLLSYKAAGGDTVVFVGERTTNATASLKFLTELQQSFDLVDKASVPNWFFTSDDCSVWKLKPEKPTVEELDPDDDGESSDLEIIDDEGGDDDVLVVEDVQRTTL